MSDYTPTTEEVRAGWMTSGPPASTVTRAVEFERWLDQIRAEERERIATQAAIRAAALFEGAWDEGNAMGLDGWIGPERGEDPDHHAIARRERTVNRLVDELRARIGATGRQEVMSDEIDNQRGESVHSPDVTSSVAVDFASRVLWDTIDEMGIEGHFYLSDTRYLAQVLYNEGLLKEILW